MNIVSSILNLVNKRVKQFGAQYFTFAIFGLINYPLAFIYEYLVHHNSDGLLIRSVSTLLCLGLFFKDKIFVNVYSKYLSLYWYFVIMVNVTMLTTLLLMQNNFSLGYLVNFNIGVIILILLVDWLSFLVIQVIGIAIAVLIYYIQHQSIPVLPSSEYINLFFYMFSCIVVLGSIFTRNKEIYNAQVQKIKDELNFDLEKTVKERTAELEYANSAKTEFLNNISHEIRTPVQGFTVISEGLADSWHEFDENKKFTLVQTIASNARRLASLLGGILDLAKFNKGKIFLNFTKFDLNALIKDIIEEANILYLHDKPISLSFASKDNIILEADFERMGQLLRNIIVNAIKYQEKGEIKISAQKHKNYVHIKIIDSGVGIPTAELKTIFKSFVQSSRTKTNAGGTGLGLSISTEIVAAHKGKIWAENNKKNGATFNITLPVTNNNTEASKIKNLKKNIVMVDDELSCLLAMEIILSKDFNLVTFTDSKLALEYLQSNNDIDLILLDLMMPGIDGIEMLGLIKNNWPHIRIIIQSGTSDQQIIDKVYELGISSFIAKPYNKDNIMQTINNLYQ